MLGSDAHPRAVRELKCGRVAGGAAADAQALGSFAAGTPFRLGLVVDGTGRVAASLNGGAVQAVTGGPAAGLSVLRIGSGATGATAMSGEVRSLILLRRATADAALPVLVASLLS
jgi:hypothetical protein